MNKYRFLALLCVCFSGLAHAQSSLPLGVMDMFELEYAADPQISPDGKQVVYVRHFSDVMADKRYTNLWIVNTDGSNHRPVSAGKHHAGNPVWSPDGDRLAYVSDEDGKPQIYIRWMDSGDTAAITNVTEAPRSLSWSPDGTQLAFAMLVPEAPLMIGERPTPPKGAKWAEPAKYTDKLVFRFDKIGEVPTGYSHLFVVPAGGGTPKQVTSGDYQHAGVWAYPPDYDWDPDGKSLVFAANRSEDWERQTPEKEIYDVSLETGEIRQLIQRKGPDQSVAVSPSGNYIAYLGYDERYQGYQLTGLYLANRDGSNPRLLSGKLDRSVGAPTWSADGRSILATYASEGVTSLASFDFEGGYAVLEKGLGGGTNAYTGGSFSQSKAGLCAFTGKTSYTASEVMIGCGRGEPKTLTSLNGDLLSQRELGEVEEIWWHSSKDQRRVQGWIIKPPGFDPAKKYPLILEIHGGPFAAYGPGFDIEKQLYAAAGYVVLYTNPRGSTTYGEEFGNLIHHAYPGDDFYDLDSGVDAVIARGYVDPEQLFITGGSGGGVLTAWSIARTHRYKAAVPFYPVIHWDNFAFTTDVVSWTINNVMPGPPWDHAENYRQRSLMMVANQVKTPTLIMTGEEDWRTPMSESEMYYKALKWQGVEAVLVRVPNEPHGIRVRPSNQISKVTTTLGWFGKFRDK